MTLSLKPSDSVLHGNTWANVRGVIELLGLEGWLEGPMLLNNITIENNTAIGLGNNFNAKIHVSVGPIEARTSHAC